MGAHVESKLSSVSALRHSCGLCALQQWCWPTELKERDLDRLHAIVRHSGLLPAGRHLFRASDRFTAVYAVRSGCIKTYTIDRSGHEHVHGFHLPGELLGFDAVYPERHHFNALLLAAGCVCIVPYRDIAGLSRQVPGLQTRILALMSREFSRQQLCTEGVDATQRIATFLFDLEARLRRHYQVDHEFDLPMSREDIANYLRFSPETMSRVMSRLQHAEVIRADRRHIRLLDVARLGQIAQGVHSSQITVMQHSGDHNETQNH